MTLPEGYHPYPVARPGFVFNEEREKLYVFSRTMTGPGSILVVRGWPPTAWFKDLSRGDKSFRNANPSGLDLNKVDFSPKEFIKEKTQPTHVSTTVKKLVAAFNKKEVNVPDTLINTSRTGPRMETLKNKALRLCFEKVPLETRQVASMFSPKCGRQFKVLFYLSRVPELLELTQGSKPNLALLYMHAHHKRLQPQPPQKTVRHLKSLLRRKQREQIERYGFEPTQRAVNILAKLDLNLSLEQIHRIRRLLASENRFAVKALCHLERINAVTLILEEERLHRYIDMKFLEDCIGQRNVPVQLLKDTFALNEALDRSRYVVSSIKELTELHDHLVTRLNQTGRASTTTFPPPPLPETEEISYIENAQDLIAAGREFHNCLASHVKAATKNLFVYRFHFKHVAYDKTEQGVFALHRDSNNRLAIREISTYCNQPVSSLSVRQILHWFRSSAVQAAITPALGNHSFDNDELTEQFQLPF